MQAAGCFWHVERDLRRLDGVVATTAGYAGGDLTHPDYEQVCRGIGGHIEAVLVEFDPEKLDYADLLQAFFDLHDPTDPYGQGPDRGPQYRSVVFYADNEQKKQAEIALETVSRSGRYRRPVITELRPWTSFWPAEPEHQGRLCD
ncbi:MAG: peptide-methionine (S)-S-oxide reductase [Deltaproteobacteria bacterium]|nr:MAG: peptide-methionine (S)-S-oxide reductase [Deltaproteobacteria bacterium]